MKPNNTSNTTNNNFNTFCFNNITSSELTSKHTNSFYNNTSDYSNNNENNNQYNQYNQNISNSLFSDIQINNENKNDDNISSSIIKELRNTRMNKLSNNLKKKFYNNILNQRNYADIESIKHIEFLDSILNYNNKNEYNDNDEITNDFIENSNHLIESQEPQETNRNTALLCPVCISGYLVFYDSEVYCTKSCINTSTKYFPLNYTIEEFYSNLKTLKTTHSKCLRRVEVINSPFDLLCSDCFYN